MFTGLVEEKGLLKSIEKRQGRLRAGIEASLVFSDVSIGDSIAVNGCCLTVVSVEGALGYFDLLEETWERTSFSGLGEGSSVNLERAMRADSRMGGHVVTGHVDGVCEVLANEQRGDNIYFQVRVPAIKAGLLVDKGCITVDGVSLTVVDVTETSFAVWMIPHTAEVTTLGSKRVGEPVNIEYDLLAKYVARQMELRA